MKIIMSAGIEPKEILVDDEDYDYFNQWSWKIGKRGYAIRGVYDHVCNGKRLYKNITLHRLAARARVGEIVDHIDRNKLNNQSLNLRLVTSQQNARNSSLPKNNTSGYKGVSFAKTLNKWEAYIGINNKKIVLGYFSTKEEAAAVYNQASKEYFGEYGYINILPIGDAKEI